MANVIIENIRSFGPIVLFSWALTIGCSLLRPQRYANSLLLMVSLLLTMLFISGFFQDDAGYFILLCFMLVAVALMLTPLLLIINGIQLLRREGICLAHCLSLGLGIFVGAGEVATVVYVLGTAGNDQYASINPVLFLAGCTVFYFSFLVLSFVVYTVFMQILPRRNAYDYVIIHGCGLLGGERLTKLLSNRVDKAIEIYEKCTVKPMIIPSGGKGDDELISEAEAMRRYLVEHEIPSDHIILEDRSATTGENVRFSKEIIDARGGGRVALVSSNYHVYRCLRIARAAGLRCTGVGAKVALYYWPSALIREFIAVFLTKRFLFWSLIGYALFILPAVVMIIG